MTTPVRNSVITFASRVGMTVIQLSLGIYLARSLDADSHGLYRTALAFVGLAVLVAKFGLGSALIFRIKRMSRPVPLVRTAGLLLTLVCAAGLTLACLALEGPLKDRVFPGIAKPGYLALVFWSVAIMLSESLLSVLQAENRFALYGRYLLGGALGRVLFVVTAILLWGARLNVALAASLAWQWVYAAVLWARTAFPHRLVGWWAEARASLSYGLRGYAYSLTSQLHRSVDVLLVSALLGAPAQTGLYAIAAAVVDRLLMIPEAIGTGWFPRLADLSPRQAATEVIHGARLSFLVVLGIVLILYFAFPLLIPLVYGDGFRDSVRSAQILLPGILLFGISRVLGRYFMAVDMQRFNTWAQSIGLAVNLALNVLWIPRYGIQGAAWATAVSYTVVTVVMLVAFRRVTNTNPLRIFLPFLPPRP